MFAKWRCVAVLGLLAVGCSTEPLDLAEFPPDGVLDCTDDNSWVLQADGPTEGGFATADEALSNALLPYLQMNDELREAQIDVPTLGSLLNDENREVVIVTATEAAPDSWHVWTETGCNGYGPAL